MLKKRFYSIRNRDAGLLAVALLGVVLHLTGIHYGLPAVFNGDEPHNVNVAVSFGRGTLNPGVFKYPTLWMYALFGSYGLYFLAWSGAGLLHSVREFGELFVWHPGAFYLLGRLLAAFFSLLALHRIYRLGGLLGSRVGLWAAALAAVSPALIESAHAAKADSLMFFFAAWAWGFALRYFLEGRPRDLNFCGLAVGLACSTQYTAAPLAALIPAAYGARWISPGAAARGKFSALKFLLTSGGCAAAAFFAGSPYALIDFPVFLRDLGDIGGAAGGGKGAGAAVVYNMANFSGQGRAGGAVLLIGAVSLLRKDRAKAVLLLVPVVLAGVFFSLQWAGGVPRYLFGLFPALALVAGLGAEAALRPTHRLLSGRPKAFKSAASAALLALLVLPGALRSWSYDRDILLPDTRTQSARWILRSIPQGTRILSEQEADSPRIPMSLPHAKRLYERTLRDGHPRSYYYRLMASGHPGGGYEVYQLRRDPDELKTGPLQVRWSSRGRPVLDVREGLAAALAEGIEVVVLSEYGAANPEVHGLKRFVSEVRARGELLAEFQPLAGEVRGPRIEIYRIGKIK